MKKFELATEYHIEFMGRRLFRIRALIAFGTVESGEVGGYVEKEENLSQDGNAWVSGNAKVYDDAEVYGNAKVSGNAWVYDNAKVSGDAEVYGDAEVSGDAEVCGNAWVCGDADYITVKGFGSIYRTTTFFREKNNGIGVKCGCFYGDLDSFRKRVRKAYGERKTAREYLMLADLIEFKMKSPEQ